MEIEEYDIVSVDFNGAQLTLCHRARVMNVPKMTGESWQFLDLTTHKTHYVSEGCTITLLEKLK